MKAVRFHVYRLQSYADNILFQENIVISAEGSPKICNSGIYSILNEPDASSMARAAPRWMAIEMAQAADAPICYSKKADVWAFGMTVYVREATHDSRTERV